MNPLTELLRPHVATLETEARAGDAKARQVINLYQMHVACPRDPAAPAFCRAAFEEWLAGHTTDIGEPETPRP